MMRKPKYSEASETYCELPDRLRCTVVAFLKNYFACASLRPNVSVSVLPLRKPAMQTAESQPESRMASTTASPFQAIGQ